jgi:hypothetical protein
VEKGEKSTYMPRNFASLKTRDCLNRMLRNSEVLHGNGVAIVPKVHAVMAWAARKTLAANER